jgi:tetratricopeptide (TPR) repeat protein
MFAGYLSLQRAENASRQGDHRLAAEEYAHAIKFLFWQRDLHELAGLSFARAGEYSAAINHFKSGENFSEDGWVWYCTSYIQLQELTSAISTCTEGTKNYDSAALYRLLAFVHRSQKDWEKERTALENQTRLDPSDAYAAYRLGLLLTLYSSENALSELTRASTLNPEVDSAVQTLRAALAVSDLQSDPSMKLVILGQAFGLVQDWELAHAAFEQAVQRNAENAEAWAWLGEANQQTGQDGRVELDRALSLNRSSVNVRALRGLYWNRLGKHEQMLAEYLLAAGIEPENPRWQASIGEAHSKLGDLVAAMMAYQRAVELAPAHPEYWRLLAMFCADNGVQVEEIGLPAAQQAFTLAPNDPAVLDALGYAYLSTGRYANAEEAFLLAIELAPDYFSAHIHLAMNFLAQGNRSAAFNALTFVRDAQNAGLYAETAQQLLDKYFP